MKALLVNYNFTPDWLKEYDLDYLILDRSDSPDYLKDFPPERVVKTSNVGNVDYDRLSFLADHYWDLPDVFLWSKSNIFKYVDEETLKKSLENGVFAPLLRKDHKTYSDRLGQVCYYSGEIYHERNDSWYLSEHHPKYFNNFKEWSVEFGLPCPEYIPFAPGGNYILTKERVHRYARDYYDRMRQTLPYTTLPGEAQMCERSYYMMWA